MGVSNVWPILANKQARKPLLPAMAMSTRGAVSLIKMLPWSDSRVIIAVCDGGDDSGQEAGSVSWLLRILVLLPVLETC